MSSKLDNQLVNESVEKILAFARGDTVAGVKGKARGFPETIELQVRVAWRRFRGWSVRPGWQGLLHTDTARACGRVCRAPCGTAAYVVAAAMRALLCGLEIDCALRVLYESWHHHHCPAR